MQKRLRVAQYRAGQCLLVMLCGVCAQAAPQTRIHQLLDSGWRFRLQPPAPNAPNVVPSWRWCALSDKIDTTAATLTSALGGQAAPLGETAHAYDDVFHGREGFALFETSVAAPKPKQRLHFDAVDDNATVFINGRRAFYHEGWNEPFDVPLPQTKPGDTLTVDVIVQNTGGQGGVTGVSFSAPESSSTPKEARPQWNDSKWRTVHLPHDYVLEGKFDPSADPGHGALPRGQAWYRKDILLPASAKGKSVWIVFEGAFSDAHVWFNGHFLGAHRSGYSSFRFDLTPWALAGKRNVIAVHLDASKTEGWWYEGGGIYRHVWLTIANPVHIAPLGGVYVTSSVANPLAAKPKATINVTTAIENQTGTPGPVRVVATVVRPDGSVVAHSSALSQNGGDVHLKLGEPNARLWSVEKPAMYKLQTALYVQGRKIDELETPFGIRTIRFDVNRGFLLNERPVKLKGTCNHQDFVGVGIGMPDSVLEWRVRRLQSMGSNAYRCSHNEVAPELLDACDRLGMVVMDENREFGDTYNGKANEHTTTNDLSDLRQEVLRDRNHPSVIMWSLCNEEFSVQATPAGGRIAAAMAKVVHQLDPTRPVTAALNGGHGHSMSAVLDLEGFNYGPPEYPDYHKTHPKQPIFGSETASTVTTRGEYADDKVRGYVKAYDTQGSNTAEDAWQPIAEEPYNAGGFVWTGFDYKGEPSPYGWPCISSHFGILDSCGFPKDNFYYYLAWWGSKPVVHIEPHWNWAGSEGKPIDVWAFANGDSVELFLNGRSLGLKTMPKYRHVNWSVPYEPGTLVAKSYSNGKLIATDRVSTTGAPAALKLTNTRKSLHADAEDCAMLEVSVVDAQGRVVPTASNLIQFKAVGSASIVGVGNGDPSSHEPDRATTRHTFHGLCLGILQASASHGLVTVTITSPGLRSVTTQVEVR